MHKCPACNKEYEDTQFKLSKVTNQPIGRCQNCRQIWQREYDRKRVEERKEYNRKRYYEQGGREKRIQSYANMSLEEKQKLSEQKRLQYQQRTEEEKQQQKYKNRQYYINTREQQCQRSQEYKLKTNYNKQYYERNKEQILIKRKNNYNSNQKFNIDRKLLNLFHHYFSNPNKVIECDLDTCGLSYTFKDVKIVFDVLLSDLGLNYSDYGQIWELDHIIPRNLFNYSNVDDRDFKICWSLMNLRPVLCSDNKSRPKDGSDISDDVKNLILNQKL